MIRYFTLSILLYFGLYAINAQTIEPSLITTAGDSFQNEAIHLDWSLGEIMIETFSDANTMLTQGLHQVEIDVVTSIKEDLISISIYPNPASEFVSLQTDYHKYPLLRTIIHDGSGRIIMENIIDSRESLIDISALNEGVYYLKIYGNGAILNTSKLIKK